MGWFDRQLAGRDPQALFTELAQLTRRLRATELIGKASGRFGLRRYIIRFERKLLRIRIVGVETEQLRNGGPPDPASFDAHAARIEKMLEDFAAGLPSGYRLERGALGVLRDEGGPVLVSWRMDEDADNYGLFELRNPKGQGSPVEDQGYLRALELWAGKVAPVRSNWVSSQESWTFEGGRLKVGTDRVWRAEPLATWVPHTGDYTWLVPEPVGDEAPFLHPTLVLEMRPALDLVAFAATRRGATGVFQGTLTQPAGVQAFFALKG
ncbi:MAG TPA: hypothetical protein PKY30_06485 [Myxococcota bacterium]|nr:hypothetical protein [Myxococcota bacterium]HND29508.1 hypothetical protein [Myxococcota bacterium]HNH46665.1 hypothetical protein [Myxococcota bacterium]